MSELIKIRYGESLSDDTYPYYVTIPAGMTVRQFINEWLKSHEHDWGYFGISDGESIFGNPRCEYSHGEIIGEPFPDDVLDKTIVSVWGNGGWSCSDFVFTVKGGTSDGSSCSDIEHNNAGSIGDNTGASGDSTEKVRLDEIRRQDALDVIRETVEDGTLADTLSLRIEELPPAGTREEYLWDVYLTGKYDGMPKWWPWDIEDDPLLEDHRYYLVTHIAYSTPMKAKYHDDPPCFEIIGATIEGTDMASYWDNTVTAWMELPETY